jgi:hypothetical protein
VLRVERVAVLERVDRHVLGAVVREHPPDLRQERDDVEVAEEEHEPQRSLGEVHEEVALAKRAAQELRREVRHADEHEERDEEGRAGHHGVPALAEPLLLRELQVRGLHEHAHAVRQRLPEDDDPAHERPPRRARSQQRRAERLAVAVDLTVRQAAGERERALSADDNAFDDGLAAVGRWGCAHA